MRLPVTPLPRHGPVAQRQRQHPYKVTTGGSSPPRTTSAQIRQRGRAARLKPERLRVRLPLWAQRLGRQLADHLGLEPGMLWVRLPPEPLQVFTNDQWPRVAAWSARLPVTQEITGSNPVEVAWKMAWYANRQSGEAQTFVTAGSTPACATFGLCSSRRPVKPLS